MHRKNFALTFLPFIFLEYIYNILLLLLPFCVFLSIRASFVIGLCAVKFARKLTPIELN
jgi:hypothetical protein